MISRYLWQLYYDIAYVKKVRDRVRLTAKAYHNSRFHRHWKFFFIECRYRQELRKMIVRYKYKRILDLRAVIRWMRAVIWFTHMLDGLYWKYALPHHWKTLLKRIAQMWKRRYFRALCNVNRDVNYFSIIQMTMNYREKMSERGIYFWANHNYERWRRGVLMALLRHFKIAYLKRTSSSRVLSRNVREYGYRLTMRKIRLMNVMC
jgi:hypothetical protein